MVKQVLMCFNEGQCESIYGGDWKRVRKHVPNREVRKHVIGGAGV